MTYPKRVIIETEYTCNLKCLTCTLWHNNYRKLRGEEKEIKLNDISNVIKRLSFDSIERISFIGGEPFLKSYFIDAVRYAKSLGFSLSVVTNGTLLNKFLIEEIVRDELFDVMIFSIDGYGSNNDKIRGAGVYEKVEENLKFIHAERKRLKKKKPNIMFYFTVSKYNYNSIAYDLNKLIKLNPSKIRIQLASSLSLDLIEKTNSFLGEVYIQSHSYKVDVGINYSSLKNIRDQIEKLRKKHQGRIVCEKIIDGSNKKCYFLFKDVVITPSGKIIPCPMMTDFVIGDINYISLKDAFNCGYDKLLKLKNLAESGSIAICRECCVEKIII